MERVSAGVLSTQRHPATAELADRPVTDRAVLFQNCSVLCALASAALLYHGANAEQHDDADSAITPGKLATLIRDRYFAYQSENRNILI